MKIWRTLLLLEYEWKVFRIYRKFINWLVGKGMRLSSPVLCKIKSRLDKHYIVLIKLQNRYEKQTGQAISYYKWDKI
jgi:hypothetical protein